MSVEFAYQFRETPPRSGFQELDDVVLTADATTNEGTIIPAGTEGTIVAVWKDGAAYMVEFAEPEGALVTLGPDGIRVVEPAIL